MTAFRSGELYVKPEIIRALITCKSEHETVEALAERYLTECLKRDYPGVFDVLNECQDQIDKAKASNKTRLDEWLRSLPAKEVKL